MNTDFQARLERLKSLLDDPSLSMEAALGKMSAEGRKPAVQQLLSRAALTRVFDRGLYEQILAEGLPRDQVPAFEAFTRLSGVSAVPGDPGRYWLDAGERGHHLREWTEQARQEELRGLHGRLAAFQETQRPEDTLTLLPHLIVVDPERARALFRSAFDAAEAAFDLPACFALLGVLDAHAGDLDPGLQEARREAQRRYRSRALIADAYWRTGTFHRRDPVHRAFREVLDGDDRWIFHLHATGGMGKTMCLRWLVARELVPAGVLCARVDFDELQLDEVRIQPWRALVPLVKQHDEQVPGHMAGTLSLIEPWLERAQPEDELPRKAYPPVDWIDRELVQHAGHALAGLGAKRVVLVLDTLEVVTPFADTVMRIFSMLEQLHALVPGLRVILAGRYEIGSRVPELAPALETHARAFELSRFDPAEAASYLASRGIVDGELSRAIVAKVTETGNGDGGGSPGCNPFKLALLADLALAGGNLTPDDIRALPSADYQYLLERVIKRIPEQPLRWVVRYGVVPRRLTLDYIEQVMLGELRRALGGEQGDDTSRPGQERPEHVRHIDGQDLWQRDPGADIGAAQLWEQLLGYESGSGWLSHSGASADHPGVIQFHGDVVDPMRDLLSYQQIFQRLQRMSVKHFYERAEAAVREADAADTQGARLAALKRWVGLCCEVVFHAFQHDGAVDAAADAAPLDAVAFWRACRDDPRLAAAPALRLTLAREPLRPEYCEDGEVPRVRHGRPLVDRETLVAAHLVAGKCIVDAMRQSGTSASRSELQRHAECARRLAGGEADADTLRAIGLLDAHLRVMDGQPREALDWVDAQSWDPDDEFARLDLTYLAARAHAAAEEAGTGAYGELVGLMERVEPGASTWNVLREAADHALALGQLTEGRQWMARAMSTAREAGCGEEALQMSLRLGYLALDLGDLAAAQELYSDMAAHAGPREYLVQLFHLSLQHVQLRSSWRLYDEVLSLVQGAASDSEYIRVQLLAAAVAHDLLRYSDAAQHWAEAARLAEREGGVALLAAIALQQVQARNRMGAYADALAIARSAESMMAADPWLAVRMRLECALALARGRARGEARAMLEPLIAAAPVGVADVVSEPQVLHRAAAIALGLALRVLPFDDALPTRLLDDLQSMQPPSRRLAMSCMAHARQPLDVPRGWAKSVLALLDEPAVRDGVVADGGDVAFMQDLQRMVAYRALGDLGRASKLLGRLGSAADTALRVLVLEEAQAWLVDAGSGWVLPRIEIPVSLDSGLLEGAITLHRAHRAMFHDDEETARSLLASAELMLTTEGLVTRWDAWMMELDGRMAAARPDGDHRHRLATAAGMYENLGDLEQSERLADDHAEAEPGAERVRATVVPMGPGGREPDRAATALLEPLAPRPGAIMAPAFAELLSHDWREARSVLTELLFTADEAAALAGPAAPDVLGLLVPPNFLAALPWELAMPRRGPASGPDDGVRHGLLWSRVREPGFRATADTIRFVQERLSGGDSRRARVDGIQGPMTTGLVRAFQEARGLDPSGVIDGALVAAVARETSVDRNRPRVLLVQPGVDTDATEQVSYASRGGRELAAYYYNWASVEVVSGAESEEVLEAVARLRPALIHVVATVRETGGMAFLDFARRRKSSRSMPINATLLDGAVKRLYADRPRPFLVFDVVRPPSTFDAVFALGWRNAMASDLHHLRTFSGILATGLEQGGMLGGVADAILEGLEQGGTMGALAQRIRGRFAQFTAPEDDERVRDATLAYLCTALFTEDPELPCLLF